MKRSIDHLPEEKQVELQELVRIINEQVPAEMIILFGSFARGDWVDDRYKEEGTTYEYRSDFDILVVVKLEKKAKLKNFNRQWRRKILRNTAHETPVNVIFHGIDYLNQEIEDGSYFFLDILQEGILLYDSGKYPLATPKALDPERRRMKAQKYYDKWLESANMFLLDFQTNFNRGKEQESHFKQAVFMLHQAAECFYLCTLLVHTDYKPKLHDLEELDRQACRIDDRFKAAFPRTNPEEERLFNLLKKAYIDSRYKLEYSIASNDLEKLSASVARLREITEISCRDKMDSMR
ncbi:MAG TPA: HEPN domain-containing protein [Cyclobacteriaceae bacterium]